MNIVAYLQARVQSMAERVQKAEEEGGEGGQGNENDESKNGESELLKDNATDAMVL